MRPDNDYLPDHDVLHDAAIDFVHKLVDYIEHRISDHVDGATADHVLDFDHSGAALYDHIHVDHGAGSSGRPAHPVDFTDDVAVRAYVHDVLHYARINHHHTEGDHVEFYYDYVPARWGHFHDDA